MTASFLYRCWPVLSSSENSFGVKDVDYPFIHFYPPSCRSDSNFSAIPTSSSGEFRPCFLHIFYIPPSVFTWWERLSNGTVRPTHRGLIKDKSVDATVMKMVFTIIIWRLQVLTSHDQKHKGLFLNRWVSRTDESICNISCSHRNIHEII